VIDVPAAIVADSGADVFGNGIQITQQFFGALGLQVGIFFQGCIQIFDIRTVVPVVMQVHSFFVDIGLEGRVVIRQGG
jgi:hypothetical protein